MNKSLPLILVICCVLATFAFFLMRQKPTPSEVTSTPLSKEMIRERTKRQNEAASRSLRIDQSTLTLANNPLDRSQLPPEALLLDDPTTPEPQVKEALHNLLSSIRFLGTEKSYPAGLNVEITNALLGLNSRKFGYLPADSGRINKNGELVDKYGTPYWFHSQTSQTLTITSAGPDRLMHTDDDVRHPTD